MNSLGVSDDLWRYQRDVALESQREMDPSDPRHKAVPPPFSNAYQLDDIPRGAGSRSSFGYPTSVFKVVSREDGHLYCLRRFDNVRSVSYKIATAVTERWNNKGATLKSGLLAVEHPGIVRFYRCFVSNRAVFFLHQYVPGARTLRERFIGTGIPLPEPLIWSCITQLVSAIRVVHAENLACRVLHLNHILCSMPDGMMDRVRLRLNCLGVVDALEFEARKQVGELQVEDMRDLGWLILSLASGTEITRTCDKDTIRRCDVYVGQNYSRELHNFVFSLLATSSNTPSIHDVSRALSSRAFDEMDLSRVAADRTEVALSSEYESGRALRLLLKLGFVNERPEFGMNRRWTESGDCYVLKLFRDYGESLLSARHFIMSIGYY
jgi:PAB-dependent poly(A)-specific ribonuclease subunit 3